MSEFKNVEIIHIGEIKTFESGFSMVEWAIRTNEQYPQTIALQSSKEKAENLLKYNKVGDKVDVSFNIRGREWVSPQGVTKYFNTLDAWKVFKSAEGVPPIPPAEVFEPAGTLNKEEEDSLPF